MDGREYLEDALLPAHDGLETCHNLAPRLLAPRLLAATCLAPTCERRLASPLAGIGHGSPRLLGRQRGAFLQQLDRVLVGRAYERHHPVARRPVDGDAGL